MLRLQLLATFMLYISLSSAWPWPPSIQNMDGLIVRRQGKSSMDTHFSLAGLTNMTLDSDKSSASASKKSSQDPNKPTATFSQPASASASATAAASASGKDSSSQSGSKETKATGKDATTAKSSQTTKTSHIPTSINPQDPPGGIQMITPAAVATSTYYKVNDYITFGWNYTSLIVPPKAIDVFVSCQLNDATYTLASNTSFNPTGVITWDTKHEATNNASPLPSEASYTLIIQDAGAAATAIPQAGYLSRYSQFVFGMYRGQSYTPLNGTLQPLLVPSLDSGPHLTNCS